MPAIIDFRRNSPSRRRAFSRRLPSTSLALRVMLAAAGLAGAAPASAAYRVEVDAPRSVKKLLTQFLDLSRYKDRDDIDADQMAFLVSAAPEQVRQLTSTEGYFAPQTKVTIESTAASGSGSDSGSGPGANSGAGSGSKSAKQTVHITVDPGPRTLVAKLDLVVEGPAATAAPAQVATMRAEWQLKPGAPFRQDDWASSKQQALRTLRSRHYADAQLASAQASIDPEAQRADLALRFDSGPPFTLGPLSIEGTSRYPAQIIRNINPLKVGEEYDADRLLELQRAIQTTPYFSNAVVEVKQDRAHPELSPVTVRVTEFPTQQVRGGFGYTTDTGAHVDGVYSHNNVFGRAYVFNSQAQIEQRRQLGSLELAMPPDASGFINSVHTSFERTTLEGVDLRSRRAGIRRALGTERNDFSYTLEYYNDDLRQIDGATLPPDTVVQPGAHQAVVAGVAWAHRRLDNLLFPRRGYAIAVELGVAAKGLLTDQSFLRGYVRGQKYFPVGQRDLVVLRAEGGAVVTSGGTAAIPASLLFRAGGTNSVRGYSYQSIGNESGGIVYPARYLATGSAEYQHWFNEQWGEAVFYDVGTATDSWADKQFFQAVGGGARWHSPVGTINADLGYGIQRHQIRPHVSLGVSF